MTAKLPLGSRGRDIRGCEYVYVLAKMRVRRGLVFLLRHHAYTMTHARAWSGTVGFVDQTIQRGRIGWVLVYGRRNRFFNFAYQADGRLYGVKRHQRKRRRSLPK